MVEPTIPGDRRRGRRREVHYVEVRWYFRAKPELVGADVPAETTNAFLVDLSLIGAGLIAPHTPHVSVGDVVGLEFRGANGLVTVRRMSPVRESEALTTYGVEFNERVSPFIDAVRDEYFRRSMMLDG